jgi:hypothetical protein
VAERADDGDQAGFDSSVHLHDPCAWTDAIDCGARRSKTLRQNCMLDDRVSLAVLTSQASSAASRGSGVVDSFRLRKPANLTPFCDAERGSWPSRQGACRSIG